MTRKSLLTLLPFLVLLALVLLVARDHPIPTRLGIEHQPLPAHTIAKEQHASDRAAYELLRTRDPETGRIPPDMRARELDFASRLPARARSFPARLERDDVSLRRATTEWESRGPWNVGGRVRGLAIDVSDPNHRTLIAGAVSGGLWRTTDDGQSWTLTSGSSHLHNVSCVAQDTRPGHQNVWYYGTGEGKAASPSRGGDSYRGDGIFKSVDGGLSWSVLPSTSTGTPQSDDQIFDVVWEVATDPSEAVLDEVYAAAGGVIARSIDGGATWEVVLGDPADPSWAVDLAVRPDGVVYAALSSDGAAAGIWVSSDGLSWSDITPPGIANWGRIVLGPAPSDPKVLYAAVSELDGGFYAGLLRYDEATGGGSGSWSDYSSNLLVMPNEAGWPYYTQRGYCTHVDVDPQNADLCYLGGVFLWRSDDGFSTTASIDWIGGWLYPDEFTRQHHADMHAVVFPPGSTGVAYSASDGGVHKTLDIHADPVVWTSLNHGFVTTQFFTVGLDEDRPGDPVLLGGTQDNGTLWTDEAVATSTWVEPLGGDGTACAVFDGAGRDYMLSYYFGHLYRSLLDASGNELNTTRFDPTGGSGYIFVAPAITDPDDRTMVYLGEGSGIWRNSDVSAVPMGSDATTSLNWLKITPYPSNDAVSAMAVSRLGDHPLYYGTAGGRVYRIDHASTLGSAVSPTDLWFGTPLPYGSYVSGVAIDPQDEKRVMVTYGNYNTPSIWFTEDGGDNWVDVEGNLAGADGPSVRCAALLRYGATTLAFVGTSTGLYSTRDLDGAATVWEQEAPDTIGNVIVDALAIRPADDLVVAATHGRGMFSLDLPDPTSAPPTPVAFRLEQNVPNPFNPRTEIRFHLREAGRVTLDVLDMRGRRVCRLEDGWRPQGENVLHWGGLDARGRPVASGTYAYRLRAAGVEESRSMTLVR